jgi:WD40 repeat protein
MSQADPKATHVIRELKYNSPFISCRFDSQGRYVFGGAQDCTLQRFEPAGGEPVECPGHDSWVRAIAFSPDGETTYSGGFDGRLIWRETAAASPAPIRTIEAHDGWVRAVAVSPDGQLLATSGNDKLIKLWKSDTGEQVGELSGHESHVYNVAFHPDGKELASCDLLCSVRHWNIAEGKQQRELKIAEMHTYDKTFRADIGGARAMAFNADGTRLALGGITNVSNAFAGVGNAAVSLIDWKEGKQIQLHKPKDDLRGSTWGLAFHPEGYLIAVVGGGSGGFFYFFDEKAATPQDEIKLPRSGRDMSLHPDGLQMAVAYFDNAIRIYKMQKEEKAEAAKDDKQQDAAKK